MNSVELLRAKSCFILLTRKEEKLWSAEVKDCCLLKCNHTLYYKSSYLAKDEPGCVDIFETPGDDAVLKLEIYKDKFTIFDRDIDKHWRQIQTDQYVKEEVTIIPNSRREEEENILSARVPSLREVATSVVCNRIVLFSLIVGGTIYACYKLK